jgi:predicted dehydrogenase
MAKQRIGIVGLGKISGIYLDNLTGNGMFSKRVTVTAVTDLIEERVNAAVEKYHVRAVKDIDTLVKDPTVDIILNITQPQNHFGVALAAIKAGKHVYDEKPLCAKREDAAEILKAAAAKKVRIGGAPDTFLGAGIQT